MITICFFGSNESDLAKKHNKDIEIFIEGLFEIHKEVRIITGGYSGIMELVSKVATNRAAEANVRLEIIGVLYSGYLEDKPNEYNHRVLKCRTLGERIDVMIEFSDIVVAMPGRLGTLHEMYHLIQCIKYPKEGCQKKSCNFMIHESWKDTMKNCGEFVYFNSDKDEIINILSDFEIQTDGIKYPPVIFNKGETIQDDIKNLANEIDVLISGKDSEENSNIIALDIAYSLIERDSETIHAMNYSYSCKEYKSVLNKFLEEYNSLLSTNNNRIECKRLSNTFCNFGKSKENIQTETLKFNKAKKQSDFDDWSKFLENSRIGKFSIWLNREIKVEGKPINLSAFLILDIDVIPNIFLDNIIILIEKFLLFHLSNITEAHLRWIAMSLLSVENFKIKGYNAGAEKIGREKERKFVVGKYSEQIQSVISQVRDKILSYGEKKDYDDIKSNIIVKISGFRLSKEKKIVFQSLSIINDITNYVEFLYGRMLFLVYHIIFKFTLKDSYELLLNKYTTEFDRNRFTKQFSIKGITSDRVTGTGIKSVIRLDEIIPFLSNAEFDFLIEICSEIVHSSTNRIVEEIMDARNAGKS